MNKFIFKGYDDLCKFWGIRPDHTCPNKWRKMNVVFLDADDSGSDGRTIGRQCAYDLKEITITFKNYKFDVLSMTGDGGFNSCLFQASDYKELMNLSRHLVFIENNHNVSESKATRDDIELKELIEKCNFRVDSFNSAYQTYRGPNGGFINISDSSFGPEYSYQEKGATNRFSTKKRDEFISFMNKKVK
jgi:hypothetical protein